MCIRIASQLARLAPIGAVLALAGGTANAQVTESFIGFNQNGGLFRFSSSTTSGMSEAAIPTTNLAGGAGTTQITGTTGSLFGIDFRPSNGLLYGLTVDSGTLRLYTINTTTGNASLVSQLVASTGGASPTATPFANALGVGYSIDFNPQTDALRITNNRRGNYRISSVNLDNGSGIAFTDMALSIPNIFGIAYTNNFVGATSTRLFDTQQEVATLYEQVFPDLGGLVPQPGSTGFGLFGDLDVSGITGFGYFAGTNGTASGFFRFNDINTSAETTLVGTFDFPTVGRVLGFAAPVAAITAAPEPGSIALALVGGICLMVAGVVRRKA